MNTLQKVLSVTFLAAAGFAAKWLVGSGIGETIEYVDDLNRDIQSNTVSIHDSKAKETLGRSPGNPTGEELLSEFQERYDTECKHLEPSEMTQECMNLLSTIAFAKSREALEQQYSNESQENESAEATGQTLRQE